MRSGSQSLNAPVLTPSASTTASHSRIRAYSRAPVGRSSGWRAARSHSSAHSTKSSRSASVSGRHWSIIAARRSGAVAPSSSGASMRTSPARS